MIKKYHSIASVVLHTNLLVSAILLIAAGFLAFYVYLTFDRQEQTIFRAHTEQVATELQQKIEDYKLQGKRLAADPQLLEAVKTGDARRIENWTGKTRTLIADVIGLAVFSPHYDLIGDAQSQQITDECIDHVKSIGNDEEYIKLDVHQEVGKLAHFEFVLPIAKTGHWLLISFSTQALINHLENTGGYAGYYEITTPKRGLILRSGENAGNSQAQVRIGDSDWQLVSRKQIRPVYSNSKIPLAVIGLVLLLTIVVYTFLSWQQIRFFKDDLKQVIRAIDANEKDDKPVAIGTNIYLKEFYDLHRRISHMILELRESREFITEQSLKDVFTGLSNERAFHKVQSKFFNMARRQMAVSMVLMDVDDMAVINKKTDHEAGDQLIKGISEILQASVRDSDECFHLGGGRFVVVMVDMEIADALKWYEFLTRRFDVLEQKVTSFRDAGLKLGVSAAAAMVTNGDMSMEDTLIRCEEVLRSVKKQCKGIIVTAKDPLFSKQKISTIEAADDERENVLQAEFHHPWQ